MLQATFSLYSNCSYWTLHSSALSLWKTGITGSIPSFCSNQVLTFLINVFHFILYHTTLLEQCFHWMTMWHNFSFLASNLCTYNCRYNVLHYPCTCRNMAVASYLALTSTTHVDLLHLQWTLYLTCSKEGALTAFVCPCDVHSIYFKFKFQKYNKIHTQTVNYISARRPSSGGLCVLVDCVHVYLLSFWNLNLK